LPVFKLPTLPKISWKTKWFSINVPEIAKPAPCVAPTQCPPAPTPCQQATPCQEVPQGTSQQPAEHHKQGTNQPPAEIHHGTNLIVIEDEDMKTKPSTVD